MINSVDVLLLCPTDPPSMPIIHGYTEKTSIAVGTVQKISCISSGGNPLATLTWYKNDKKVSTALFCTIKICTVHRSRDPCGV
jgi:hypothetical protein